jgi:DNA-directed RNA polymerase alpha subunit
MTKLNRLALRERNNAIYALRYGSKPKTLAAIGRKYKLSRQRVKQIADEMMRQDIESIPWERSVAGDKPAIQEFLNTPLSDFPLGTRAGNCLRASGIRTIGELATKKPEALLQIRHFGKTTLKELEELLSKIMLNGMPMRLGMSRRSLASPGFGQETLRQIGLFIRQIGLRAAL